MANILKIVLVVCVISANYSEKFPDEKLAEKSEREPIENLKAVRTSNGIKVTWTWEEIPDLKTQFIITMKYTQNKVETNDTTVVLDIKYIETYGFEYELPISLPGKYKFKVKVKDTILLQVPETAYTEDIIVYPSKPIIIGYEPLSTSQVLVKWKPGKISANEFIFEDNYKTYPNIKNKYEFTDTLPTPGEKYHFTLVAKAYDLESSETQSDFMTLPSPPLIVSIDQFIADEVVVNWQTGDGLSDTYFVYVDGVNKTQVKIKKNVPYTMKAPKSSGHHEVRMRSASLGLLSKWSKPYRL